MKLKLNVTYALTLIILFFSVDSFAQNTYYKVNGGGTIDEKSYTEFKENMAKDGKIEELHLKTIEKKDSIINYIKLGKPVTTPDGFDPWGETKKFIGTKFPIEKYVDNDSKNFNSNYLEGKPTFINFWFTRCPPCIEELPTLNKLKEKYGDRVNFVSITYENQKAIDEFLKKYEFNFKHIPNSEKQIDELSISGYPTSIILDKNGIIKIVFPQIPEHELKDIETTLDILL